MIQTFGIIGGGAWGTALAASLCVAGRDALLWAREPEVVDAINARHENTPFLAGAKLPKALKATTDLAMAAQADALLLVTPAQHMRSVAHDLQPHLPRGIPLIICSKGIEESSLELLSPILEQICPGHPIAILSGPTFAIEVARGLPTAVTLACEDEALGEQLIAAIGHARFRPYLTDDVIGAQIGGAVKNVLAIAAGVVVGKKLGANAHAAVITRGLAEILRLAEQLGGRAETLMGLSGLGDLVLTCSSQTSRNMSLGFALGEGKTLAQIMETRTSVAEGVHTAKAVHALAAKLDVDMPICSAMYRVLHEGAHLMDEIEGLLHRPFGHEN